MKKNAPSDGPKSTKYLRLLKEKDHDAVPAIEVPRSIDPEVAKHDPLQAATSLAMLKRRDAMNELLRMELEELNIDPVENPTAYELVKATHTIRWYKEQLKLYPKYYRRYREASRLRTARRKLMDALRAEDYDLFLLVTDKLGLEYKDTPWNTAALSMKRPERDVRIKAVKNSCYELRMNKLKELQTTLEEKKEEFYRRKQDILQKLDVQLAAHGLTLEDAMDSVLKERQRAAEEPVIKYRLQWYYREFELKELYLKKMEEKAERQKQQQRKK